MANEASGACRVAELASSQTENGSIECGNEKAHSANPAVDSIHYESKAELGLPAEKTESIHPAPIKVLRSKRRGLLGRFSLLAEVEEPKDYRRGTKWFITFVIAMAAVAAPLGSAIILRELPLSFGNRQ